MDNVLVDFPSGIARIPSEVVDQYDERPHNVPGIFSLMDPLPGALESSGRTTVHRAAVGLVSPSEDPLIGDQPGQPGR